MWLGERNSATTSALGGPPPMTNVDKVSIGCDEFKQSGTKQGFHIFWLSDAFFSLLILRNVSLRVKNSEINA